MDHSELCSNIPDCENSNVNKLVKKCLAARPTMRNAVNSKYGRVTSNSLNKAGKILLKDNFLRLPNDSPVFNSTEPEVDNTEKSDMKKICMRLSRKLNLIWQMLIQNFTDS